MAAIAEMLPGMCVLSFGRARTAILVVAYLVNLLSMKAIWTMSQNSMIALA
jgi:hypothetical protein